MYSKSFGKDNNIKVSIYPANKIDIAIRIESNNEIIDSFKICINNIEVTSGDSTGSHTKDINILRYMNGYHYKTPVLVLSANKDENKYIEYTVAKNANIDIIVNKEKTSFESIDLMQMLGK